MVSVIIPVHNTQDYLEKAVNSVLSQTYTDYEIILIDDGCTDSSGKICDGFAEKSDKVRVIHKEYEGVSTARNIGIAAAKGEYIYFIDSDDYIDSTCLEKLMNAINENGADMAMADMILVDADGNRLDEFNGNSPFKDEVLTAGEFFKKFGENSAYYYCRACNKVIRKSFFDDIKYPDGKLYEDDATVHYIAYKCKKIVCLKEGLYYYVKHKKSITGVVFSERQMDKDLAYCDRVRFLKEKGYEDIAKRAAMVTLYNFHTTLKRSAEAGEEKLAVNTLGKIMKDEYKFAKELIDNQSFSMKLFYYFVACRPKLYVFALKLKNKILK